MLSAIKEAWDFVDLKLKRLYIFLLLLRLITNIFDLIGTALMAILVGYVVSALSGQANFDTIAPFIKFLNLQDLDIRTQVIVFGIITLSVFVLRPLIVMPVSRFIGFGIHRQGAVLTNDLITKFTKLPLSSIRQWSSPEVNYAVNSGLPVVLGLLWTTISLFSDVSLILMFFVLLLLTNPVITLGLIFYVVILFSLLAWINGSRITNAGKVGAATSSKSIKNVNELLSMFRELYVSDRLDFQINSFKENRIQQGDSIAIVEWLNQLPRFIIDTALILGIIVVAIGQANSNSITSAATGVTLFLTAALRILPTIAPIQGSVNWIKNSIGGTLKVHEFSNFVEKNFFSRSIYLDNLANLKVNSEKFDIKVNNLSLKYPTMDRFAIENISFTVESGKTLALIGSSGSGKTTLADCILGLLEPTSGQVEIGDISPEICRVINSGSISYVSQDVALIDGSIRENVAFALPDSEINDEDIKKALHRAHILEFVSTLPEGLGTVVGERGTRLSGGQRQRIGIARALYSKPKLLVLDEATSALDAETESAITEMLKELHGEVTIISIAHRLSTVMHSDVVLFLRDGKLVGSGKFAELVRQHPDLAHQAELLGIDIEDGNEKV